jgi:hypothetical protein
MSFHYQEYAYHSRFIFLYLHLATMKAKYKEDLGG